MIVGDRLQDWTGYCKKRVDRTVYKFFVPGPNECEH